MMIVIEELLIRPMREEDIPYVQDIDRLSFSMPWPAGAYEYELKTNNSATTPGKPGRSSQWVAVIDLSQGARFPEPAVTSEPADPQLSSARISSARISSAISQQEKIIGMVVVWYIIDEVHIATLAVHPNYRHQGVANQLLKKVLSEADRHGFHVITLEVRAGNHAAQALYRKFGFEIVGKRPRYYKDNQEDAYIMTLKEMETHR